MNRLTRRDPDGAANFAGADFESVCAELTPENREKVRAIVDKLAEYEDAEEQRRLVRLPVKIGQKVYRHRYTGKGDNRCVVEWTVSAIAFLGGQKVDITFRRGQDEFFHCEYGGANWRVTYMTREEAEAALKGGGI